MRKYTRKIHIQRLREMLKKEELCKCCPATEDFRGSGISGDLWSSEVHPCAICREFVGLPSPCPCFALGKEGAIRKTIEALEAEDA